jgi:hypothetical protein
VNWRTPITMVVLLGVLLGAAYYGWQTVVNPGDDKKTTTEPTETKPTCDHKATIKKGTRILAKDVVVNVYNAGNRSGLAGETLDELVDKGFKRGIADNAPTDIKAGPNVAVVLPGGKGLPQMRLVHNQFVGVVKYVSGPELAAGVDVVVGDSFHGVDQAARTFVRVNRVVKTCGGSAKDNG